MSSGTCARGGNQLGAQGFVPQRADLATAIDLQYLDAAVARLGPQR